MWIGKRYKNSVYNPPDGSRWKVIKKLSERVVLSDSYQYEMGRDTSEVHAVYRVRQTHGKSVGKKAILKVSMQIPEDGGKDVSLDHSVRAREASDIYGIATMRETHALTWLTERNCSVSPRLLSLVVGKQEGSTMPVPGGWIVFILMDMVPGVNLEEFRYFDFAKRERIRQAFLKSMTEIYSHNVVLFDSRPANVIYDEDQDKCYFVDFEDSHVDSTRFEAISTIFEDEYMAESELQMWGLDDRMLGLVGPVHGPDQEDECLREKVTKTDYAEEGVLLVTV